MFDCESACMDIINKTMELLLPLCVKNVWNFTVELCEIMIYTTSNLCGQMMLLSLEDTCKISTNSTWMD